MLHVEYLIKAGAEQILFSRLAPLAWLAHPLALRLTAISEVNTTGQAAKPQTDIARKPPTTCNFETNIARVFYEISTASEFFTADYCDGDRGAVTTVGAKDLEYKPWVA